MVTIFVHRDGRTEQVSSIDRAWIDPASGVALWVDLAAPSIPESLILSDTFRFHPLSVEDAMSIRQYPKAEAYDGVLLRHPARDRLPHQGGPSFRHARHRLLRRAQLSRDGSRRRLHRHQRAA
jgi:hypothetical protein